MSAPTKLGTPHRITITPHPKHKRWAIARCRECAYRELVHGSALITREWCPPRNCTRKVLST